MKRYPGPDGVAADESAVDIEGWLCQQPPHWANGPFIATLRHPLVQVATTVIPITVREVMSSPAVTVPADRPVERVARRLRKETIGSAIVVADGEPVGIVELTDIVDLVIEEIDLEATPVGEVTAGEPPTVAPAAPVQRAVAVFRDTGRKRLAVLEDGELVGVVTTTDLATYIPQVGSRIGTDGGVLAADRPGTNDTAYDRVDWAFTDDGDRPESIEEGETFRFEKRLSAADVAAFAEASGDTNRLHLDEAFAAETRFGGRIVHGALTAGVISAALARLPGTVIYLSQNLSFRGPVGINETVAAEVTATERLAADRWRFETVLRDDDGDPALTGDATILLEK